ncbi:MAG TPA: mechanosensitive ion channel family protein, partial [Bacteroidia bacterium]|nr:mechanosensitive ion channel family protein [Bacteroidia bacterium]
QIFNTILLTADHRTVILPNGPLSNGTIVNISRQGNLRIDLSFFLDPKTSIAKVQTTVHEVLKANPLVLGHPKAQVLFAVSESGAIQLRVKPYCQSDQVVLLSSSLYLELKQAFDRNGILTAVPQQRIQTS